MKYSWWTICPSVSLETLHCDHPFQGRICPTRMKASLQPDCLIKTTLEKRLEGLRSYKNVLKIQEKWGGRASLGSSPKSGFAFKWAYFCGQLMVRFKAFLMITRWACAWIRLHHKHNIYLLTWRSSFLFWKILIIFQVVVVGPISLLHSITSRRHLETRVELPYKKAARIALRKIWI